jgi:putative flippase GtrA
MMSSRFVRFLLTGGCAALVNLGSRYALNVFMSFEAAVAVAFLFGVTTGYALAKIFVFDKSGLTVATEFRRFVMVNLLSLAVVWSVSVGLAFYVFPAFAFRWHAEDVAHLIGVLSPSVGAYFVHKHYTFRGEERSDLGDGPDTVAGGASALIPREMQPLGVILLPQPEIGAPEFSTQTAPSDREQQERDASAVSSRLPYKGEIEE